MAKNLIITGILAICLTPLLISGGFDISFGANLALASVVITLLYSNGVNVWIALVAGIFLSTLIGFLNGVLIESFQLIAIILTLGMMSILRSIASVLSHSNTVLMLSDGLFNLAMGSLFKIPLLVFIFIPFILINWFILNFTKAGRAIYIIGANPNFARLSGIKVKKIRVLLYTFVGFSAGISSILMISLTGVGSPFHGDNIPLPILSAVFVGGLSMAGGRGNISGTLLGILIMQILFNGLSVLNIQSFFIQILQGVTLILIVAIYGLLNKNRIFTN